MFTMMIVLVQLTSLIHVRDPVQIEVNKLCSSNACDVFWMVNMMTRLHLKSEPHWPLHNWGPLCILLLNLALQQSCLHFKQNIILCLMEHSDSHLAL
jgi:hypothetical protein